ncbi:MAG: hypothetical protein IPL40_00065 [Proteobacteria bacterium]|nr:hypothetical protein [Pseudomonadota bacterium]
MGKRSYKLFGPRLASATALALIAKALVLLLAASLPLAACGDTVAVATGDGGLKSDAASSSTGCTTNCRDFVVNRLLLPTATKSYAIDLTGDGKVDNEFRTSLTFVASLSDGDFQTQVDESVFEGKTLLTLRMRAADFANTSNAQGQLWLADDQTCCDSNDLAACGLEAAARCFNGSHLFTPAANSPNDLLFGGKITTGAFDLGPAKLQLELTMADTIRPILTIEQAHIRGTLTGTTITSGIIAGAFNVDQLLQVAVDLGNATLVEKPTGSTADTIRSTFQLGAGQQLTLAIVRGNLLVKELFHADLPNNRMSIGLGFTAVGATISAQ